MSDHTEPLVYTMRDLNRAAARVMQEIRKSGQPAIITHYGHFIALITPRTPGQALAAIARSIDVTGTANAEMRAGLRGAARETTQTTPEETR